MTNSPIAGIFLSRKKVPDSRARWEQEGETGRKSHHSETPTQTPPVFSSSFQKTSLKKIRLQRSKPKPFVPLKANLQGEGRKGRLSQLCFPADPNTPGWRDQGPGGELRSAAGGSVFPRFPRLLPLEQHSWDRAAAGGDGDNIHRLTCPRHLPFLTGEMGQSKVIRLSYKK